MPSSTPSTVSRWDGFGTALGADRDGTLELAEHLPVGLAGDVGQHVEATPVRHADRGAVEPRLGRALQDLVEEGDQRLAALEAEALLADVLRLQERLERLGLVQLLQHAQLLVVRGLLVLDLDVVLEPATLIGILDVHVLDADRAAVRVAQHPEDVAKLHHALAAEAAGDELAVEVPEGQTVLLDLEVGVGALDVLERVDVGHEVAANPEGVDELVNAGLLVDALGDVDVDVVRPADRGVRDAQRCEDVVVEAALADQQLVHALEELARPGALDDTVVVGARECDRLADRHLVERFGAGALELRGVVQRAGADDAALTLHQSRHRVHGADAAGVGQRDRRALEVGRGELVLARPADEVLVGGEVLAEGERLRSLDRGHQEGAGAVGLGDVDRDAQVDVGRRHHRGLAVDLGVEHVLARDLLERPDDRPADEVREADLAAARARHVVVDHDAVVDHELRRNGAHARGGGHGQRFIHVRGEGLRHAAQRGDRVLLGRLLSRGGHDLRRLGRDRLRGSRLRGGAPMTGTGAVTGCAVGAAPSGAGTSPLTGLYSSRIGHHALSTEFLSTLNCSYSSSTSHSLAPNSPSLETPTPVTWLDTPYRPLS